MELVWLHVLQHGTGIVNLSLNGPNYLFAFGTVGYKIKELATPVVIDVGWSYIYYPGALVVQSAGNNGIDACQFAYYDPNVGHDVNNGVMVVGGLHFDDALTPVNPGDGTGPYYEPSIISFFPVQGNFSGLAQDGTNYGPCVEVWAPSNKIISTWTNGSYQQLSGTSMAAPHVAGFAARILQNTPGLNSQQLEEVVRLKFRYIGMQPWSPLPMYLPDFGN